MWRVWRFDKGDVLTMKGRMNERTRRQIIAEILRERSWGVSPTVMSDALSDHDIELSPDEIIDEIYEIKQSLDDEQVLVKPPACRSCGFDRYDSLLNIPSQCPDCKSEYIDEPEFVIDEP